VCIRLALAIRRGRGEMRRGIGIGGTNRWWLGKRDEWRTFSEGG